MQPYGTAHLAALAVAVVAGVVFVWGAKRFRGTDAEHLALGIAGWVMLITSIAWIGWEMLPMNWDIERSLPFHLSDVLRITTSLALITRQGWAIAISYYWGLTLNIQSVITPDLNYASLVPVEYAEYWFVHIMALLTPIVFVWGLGYRPSWRGYWFVFVLTLVWAAIAGTVNALTGANYMYLARAPEGPSALDLFGGWPTYIIWEVVLVASVWALITLPWNVGRALQAPFSDRIGLVRRRVSPFDPTIDNAKGSPD